MPFIEAILTSDRRAPRKQRHTAHRIWQRIKAEWPEVVVAESTIRKYVARTQAGAGMVDAHHLRAAELRAGAGRPGRLVRGMGGVERRAGQVAGVLATQHGERRRLPSRVSARDAAGVSRGP